MRDYERLRALQRAFLPPRNDFISWYLLLKECFPVSDATLSCMMGVDPILFSRWRTGNRKPSRAALRLMALLCLVRIGGPHDLEEIIHLGQRMMTGGFTKHVLGFLAHEKEELARRAARKAAKAQAKAKTSTETSTEPPKTA